MNKFVRVLLPLFFMLFFTVVLGVMLNEKLRTFFSASKWVTHTYEVLVAVEDCHEDFNNSDAEYLFFLVNNNDYHARQHFQVQATAFYKLQQIQNMTDDNSVQLSNLEDLKKKAWARAKFTENVIIKKRKGEPIPEVGSEVCVKLRQDVRDAFSTVLAEEKRLLEDRQEKNSAAILHITIYLIGLVILSSSSLSFVVGVVYSDLRKKETLDGFLDRIKK